MKRKAKHNFAHEDPENLKQSKVTEEKKNITSDDFTLIKNDLKRTGITISLFVVAILTLYVIKIRTDWFTVLLSKIGL